MRSLINVFFNEKEMVMIRNTTIPLNYVSKQTNFTDSSVPAPATSLSAIINSSSTSPAVARNQEIDEEIDEVIRDLQCAKMKLLAIIGKRKTIEENIAAIPATPPIPTVIENKRVRLNVPSIPEAPKNIPKVINTSTLAGTGESKYIEITAGTSVEAISNIHNAYIIIAAQAPVETVREISTSVKEVFISPKAPAEAIRNIPSHITRVVFYKGMSVEAINNLPAQVHTVTIGGISKEGTVENIPVHVYQVNVLDGFPEIINIPTHVKIIGITPKTLVETIKHIPTHVIQVAIYGKISIDAIKSIPAHVREVRINASSPPETIKNIPLHITRVVLCREIPIPIIKSIPAHVKDIAIHPATSLAEIINIPRSVLTVYLPRHLNKLIPSFPDSIKTIHFV
jgi:hypothetical protein